MLSSGSCRDPSSGPFLPDVPDFHVSSESVSSQPRSSSRALPHHLHFANCSDVFCFISACNVPNHSNLLLLMAIAMGSTFASFKNSSFLRSSSRLTTIAHRTIFDTPSSSLLLPYTFHLLLTLTAIVCEIAHTRTFFSLPIKIT